MLVYLTWVFMVLLNWGFCGCLGVSLDCSRRNCLEMMFSPQNLANRMWIVRWVCRKYGIWRCNQGVCRKYGIWRCTQRVCRKYGIWQCCILSWSWEFCQLDGCWFFGCSLNWLFGRFVWWLFGFLVIWLVGYVRWYDKGVCSLSVMIGWMGCWLLSWLVAWLVERL